MRWTSWGLVGWAALAGCSREPLAEQKKPLPVASAEPAPAPPAALRPASWPERAAQRFEPVEVPLAAGEGRAGSALALVTLAGRRLALVADDDQGALLVIDREKQAVLSSTPLRGRPSQLVVRGHDGRVYVALRDRNSVQAYEAPGDLAAPLVLRGELATATEPVGLALAPDEATLLVTTGWGRQLEGFPLDARATEFSVSLPREPRAVVVAEGRAFVSHVVGSQLSVVDLAAGGSAARTARALATSGKDRVDPPPIHICFAGPDGFFPGVESRPAVETPRSSVQGYALASVGSRIYAPFVLVDPGEARIPSVGSYGAVGAVFPPEVPAVAVVEARSEKVSAGSLLVQGLPGPRPCLLPRAAVGHRAEKSSVLVACQGVDAVIEYDGQAVDPARAELRRWSVPAGPAAIALDPQGDEAVVWSQFDRALSHFSLAKAPRGGKKSPAEAPVSRLALPDSEAAPGWLSDEARLGRRLFHATGNPQIAQDGRACASCHPDGRDDGLTWSSPDGARNTPMLAGRLRGTEPFSWNGAHPTIEAHVKHTLSRLHGKGLAAEDLRAIEAYLVSLPVPTRSFPVTSERVARGRQLFRSPEAMCSLCHGEQAPYTDKVSHDVKSGQTLDTPSLLFVGGTGPYFHDGRYATLRDLLRDNGGKMGQTSHLSPPDLDALEAYLETL